jgi:septal ring factor EnvC (AmiA/AmiB activator)
MTDKTIAGLLITGLTVLASVVGYLFRLYIGRNKEISAEQATMTKERAEWAAERGKIASDMAAERARTAFDIELKESEIRVEYEKRFREVIERYDQAARRDSERHREHEDQVRKEFAEIMERVSAEASKSAAAMVQMLQKFYERMVGPRGH